MDIVGLDIGHIVELGTQVAQVGAFRAVDIANDQIFDYIIGIVFLVYALDPASE